MLSNKSREVNKSRFVDAKLHRNVFAAKLFSLIFVNNAKFLQIGGDTRGEGFRALGNRTRI